MVVSEPMPLPYLAEAVRRATAASRDLDDTNDAESKYICLLHKNRDLPGKHLPVIIIYCV